jgi:SAM-dependent methyltransferase
MHYHIEEFVREFYKERHPFKYILDVGSRDINGSVRKSLAKLPEYEKDNPKFTGVDMIAGEGVDIVLNAHALYYDFDEESFDLVTCCETLEHDDKFWITLEQMKRVLKKGGWLFITTPSIGFPLHSYPYDYYRYTPFAYDHVLFEGMENKRIVEIPVFEEGNPITCVMGYAQKV